MRCTRYRMSRVLIILILLLSSGCHVGRFIYWNYVDVNDYKKFHSISVKKSKNPFDFFVNEQPELFNKIAYDGKFYNMDSLISNRKNKTIAFIVIRNDTVLYQKYLKGFKEESIVPSFSMAKSFTSALIGIAIADGNISSVNQPVSDFLPELCNKNPRFSDLTIKHLLNMRSGIRFNENAYLNPFNGITQLYYGTNLKKQMLKSKMKSEPDKRYEYQSINSLILGLVLEKATGKSPAKYLEEKIWTRIGMKYDASWSVDSKRNKIVKAYCCINATAIDYAKFGRLFLNKGNWEGKQIIPEYWVDRSGTPTSPNKSYQYNWYSVRRPKYFNDSTSAIQNKQQNQRVFKSERFPDKYYVRNYGPAYVASGLLGQFIYIEPEKNLIIVRLGKRKGKIAWFQLMEGIAEIL